VSGSARQDLAGLRSGPDQPMRSGPTRRSVPPDTIHRSSVWLGSARGQRRGRVMFTVVVVVEFPVWSDNDKQMGAISIVPSSAGGN
jgi:hypothetical protein